MLLDGQGKARETAYADYKKLPKNSLSWTHLVSSEEKAVDFVLDELGQDEEFEEDILEDQRPRLSAEHSYDIIVLTVPIKKIAKAHESEDALLQLSFIAFQHRLITVADMKAPIIDQIFTQLGKKGLETPSVSSLFNFIVSGVVENSIDAMELVEKRIDQIQSTIIQGKTLQEMLTLSEQIKETLYYSTKLLRADLEVFWEILAGKAISIKAELFYEHIEDRVLYLIDLSEGLRESLQNILNLYLAALSNRMNQHIYRLTNIGAFFLIPTMIASIWGMNVELPFHNFWSILLVSFGVSFIFAIYLWLIKR